MRPNLERELWLWLYGSRGAYTVPELAYLLSVSRQAVDRGLKRLERQGYVAQSRRSHPTHWGITVEGYAVGLERMGLLGSPSWG